MIAGECAAVIEEQTETEAPEADETVEWRPFWEARLNEALETGRPLKWADLKWLSVFVAVFVLTDQVWHYVSGLSLWAKLAAELAVLGAYGYILVLAMARNEARTQQMPPPKVLPLRTVAALFQCMLVVVLVINGLFYLGGLAWEHLVGALQ